MTFLACKVDLFNLAGTHVDIYPYSITSITIINLYKSKIMTTGSSFPKNPDVGHHRILCPCVSYLLYPYPFTFWFFTSRSCRTRSFSLIRPYLLQNHPWVLLVHVCAYSRNTRACASMHPRTLSRNVYLCASVIILARTSVYLFVYAHDSVSICECVPAGIRSCGGFSVCLSVVLSNTLL